MVFRVLIDIEFFEPSNDRFPGIIYKMAAGKIRIFATAVRDDKLLLRNKDQMMKLLAIKSNAAVNFIGLKIGSDRTVRQIHTSQTAYLRRIIEKCGMEESKPADIENVFTLTGI